MRSHQLALTVIADDRHDGVDVFVVGDATSVALDLAQRVGVLTDLGVLDGAERNVAVSVILYSLDKLRALALNLAQLKAELVCLEVAAGQGLGRLDLVGNTGLNMIRSIGVLELSLARGLRRRSLKLALLIGLHCHGELCNVVAVGDAVDRGPGMLLANLVGIRARLVIGNLAEANARMALCCNRNLGLRHRGVALGRQAKLKLVLIRPVASLEHLDQAKVGSCQRCRLGIERKVNLAVIAQVDIDLRRTRNNLRVVPLGIDHVACGVRRVSAHTLLGGVELIDKGEARGASLNRPVIAILYQSAFKAFKLASLNRDRNGIIVRRARRVLRHKPVFVPISLRARRLFRCKLGAGCVRIDGRQLLEVVVAVRGGRLKACDRIAHIVAGPLVGVEADGIGIGVLVLVDIILQPRYVIGSKQIRARNRLYARCIHHADRRNSIRGVNHKRTRRLVNGKAAQRNERCGNLDRHDVAALWIVLVRAIDRNYEMGELAVKRIGINIAIGRLGGGTIGLAVVLGTGKAIDLHEGAQLVLECDVAGTVGIVALDLGRETLARRNSTRDVLKDLIKLGGVGRRLVVAGTGNGVAKIDIPLLSKKAMAYGRCGLRIVTRHGMHELILIARVVACWIVVRLRTVEDTDGINGRPAALYGLGGIDGVPSDRGLKITRARR